MLACLQDRNDGVTGHRLLRQCYFQGRVMWALERPHLRAGGCVREALRQLRALRSKQNKKKNKEVGKFLCSLQRAKAGEAEHRVMRSPQLAELWAPWPGGTMLKPWLGHPSSSKEGPVPLIEGAVLLVPRLSESGQLRSLQCLENLQCARCSTVVPEGLRVPEPWKWLESPGNWGNTDFCSTRRWVVGF